MAASRCRPDSARWSRPTIWEPRAISRWRPMAMSMSSLQGGRNQKDGAVALRDTKGDGHFDVKEYFGSGSTTGIALHNGYLYLAHPTSVERYKMTPGNWFLRARPRRLSATSPLQREHEDKGIAFDGKGGLYINFGAPSNACQPRDRAPKVPGDDPCPLLEKFGGVWKFDENKLGQKQEDGQKFATGMRQMPAITWHDGALWIVMNSRDQLDTLWQGHVHGAGKRRAPRGADVPRCHGGREFRLAVLFLRLRPAEASAQSRIRRRREDAGALHPVFASHRQLSRRTGRRWT